MLNLVIAVINDTYANLLHSKNNVAFIYERINVIASIEREMG